MADTDWTQQAGMDSVSDSVTTAGFADAAEASAEAAAASESNAATSETNAATSASAASSSASGASSSASTAQTAAASAQTAQTAAEAAQTAAETAETNAASSATSASNSATSASGSSTSAASYAANALASQTAAATSETNASGSATTASNAATAASQSASSADTSEANALTYSQNAATSATNAQTSANSAATSATSAQTVYDQLDGEVAAAASSATDAAASASAAASSATSANTSAGNAAASATQALASANAALSALDNFDDRYLGTKTQDPTIDNDGNALVAGALYFNTTNDTMFVYDGSLWRAAYVDGTGLVLRAGDTMYGNLNFGDNDKAIFGDGNDLQIYYNGTDSVIRQTTDGDILIQTDGADSIKLGDEFGNYLLTVNDNGNVELFHGTTPSKKLETTSTGVSVTGNATFPDNGKAIFGAGSDLQIYHDGSASYIKENGTGALVIDGTELYLRNSLGSSFLTTASGAVRLHNSGSQKLATTSTGIDVTGTVTADGLSVKVASNPTITLHRDDTTILGGEEVGRINFAGTDPSGTNIGASIHAEAGTAWSATDYDSELVFSTVPNSSGTLTERLRIASTGDISFYEDTGTTAKLFWDADVERLGLGTTTPSAQLHVNNSSGNADFLLDAINTGSSTIYFGDTDSNLTGRLQYNHASDYMAMFTNNGERLRITSSGSVGLGTSSPQAKLHIASTAPSLLIDDTDSNVILRMSAGSTASYIQSGTDYVSGSAAPIIFSNIFAANEWMRLDASGNLLVGKSALNTNTVGLQLESDGYLSACRDGGNVALINRKTSDGAIVTLQKDGTTVGSIGTANGYASIGSADTGILFNSNNEFIQPWDITSNASRDAAISLGNSSNRFKDLYLSGGVYLGGTGASNHLDDYETGTFTPTLGLVTVSYTNQTGDYVKIGNIVHCYISIDVSSLDTADASGFNISLPFTPVSGRILGFNLDSNNSTLITNKSNILGARNASGASFILTDDGGDYTYSDGTNSSGVIRVGVTIEVA